MNTQHTSAVSETAPSEHRIGLAEHGVAAESVWQFLLDSGFLYPAKLSSLDVGSSHAALRALLTAPRDLSMVLLASRQGRIEGHVSGFRAYPHTWFIQHLAVARGARKSLRITGRSLAVAMLEALERQPSARWIRLSYRPDNAWPRRMFGGFAETLLGAIRPDGSQRKQSPEAQLRTEWYAVSSTRAVGASVLRSGITARAALAADLPDLCAHLHECGDALSIQAEAIGADTLSLTPLDDEYLARGLMRRREVLVAELGGRCQGFALLEIATPGINFSELTNSFRLVVPSSHPDVVAALLTAARERYRVLGRPSCIVLARDEEAGFCDAAGFERRRRYSRLTLKGDLLPSFKAYLLRPKHGSEGP